MKTKRNKRSSTKNEMKSVENKMNSANKGMKSASKEMKSVKLSASNAKKGLRKGRRLKLPKLPREKKGKLKDKPRKPTKRLVRLKTKSHLKKIPHRHPLKVKRREARLRWFTSARKLKMRPVLLPLLSLRWSTRQRMSPKSQLLRLKSARTPKRTTKTKRLVMKKRTRDKRVTTRLVSSSEMLPFRIRKS